MTQMRVPGGVPAGGQFATADRTEADIELRDSDLTPDTRPTVDRRAEDLSIGDTVWIDGRNLVVTSHEPSETPEWVVIGFDGAYHDRLPFGRDAVLEVIPDPAPDPTPDPGSDNFEAEGIQALLADAHDKLAEPEHYSPADIDGLRDQVERLHARLSHLRTAHPRPDQLRPVTPEARFDAACTDYHQAKERSTRAAVDYLRVAARSAWPGAAYIELEDSDQDDGMVATTVYNQAGTVIGRMEDADDNPPAGAPAAALAAVAEAAEAAHAAAWLPHSGYGWEDAVADQANIPGRLRGPRNRLLTIPPA